MNIVLQTSERTLVSLSSEELTAITSSLNEICNGAAIADSEFQTRLGLGQEFLRSVLRGLESQSGKDLRGYAAIDVWADQSSVMVRSITAFGDSVEMGESEAAEFSARLQAAISEAS